MMVYSVHNYRVVTPGASSLARASVYNIYEGELHVYLAVLNHLEATLDEIAEVLERSQTIPSSI